MLNKHKLLYSAYRYAEGYSTDPSTQNGAVIIGGDGEVEIWGVNKFPHGVIDTPERWERPQKYYYIEHAERAVIFNAARNGLCTYGKTLVAPWFACPDCARAIICAGIKRVIGHQSPNDWSPERWMEPVKIGLQMLKEAGVEMQWYQGPIGGIKILFNGEIKEP